MEEDFGIKAYVQKTMGILKMVELMGFSLGVNKNYYGSGAENFNPLEENSKNNNAYLTSITRTDNCSVDLFADSEGVFYVAMTDPAFLFHGFKIEDEPFSKILGGDSLSITFMERDSLSLALAVNMVNTLGGTVTLDGAKVHSCTDENCIYPLLSKEDMIKGLDGDSTEISNGRYYKEVNISRTAVALSPDFINQLHEANPELDKGKIGLSRIKKYTEYFEDKSIIKNQVKIKKGA